MKTKKKTTNTYKFQSFAQRISSINITVFTQTGANFHGIPENEKDTFFRETLEKLGEVNCSLDFISLYKELKPHVRTFNLLIYHKEKVVGLLKQYLSLEGSFATKACLELVASLSRDLSQDFYPIFEELFGVLVQLMKRKDAALIEDTFVCLAYVFKCTWRYMVNEIENIFRNFKCLLSDTQAHIQSFASELFAFLIQKSKKRKRVVEGLIKEASKEPSLAVGVGCLIFQTIKGIKYQFILSANEILNVCLKIFLLPDIDKDQVFNALQATWLSSLKHTTPEYSGILFTSLYESIKEVSSGCADIDASLSYYYKLLNVAVSQKHGYYVEDQSKLFEVLGQQFASESLTSKDASSLLILLKSCIEITRLKITDSDLIKLFINFLNYEQISVLEKLDFCRSLFSWNKFDDNLKDPILEYVCKCLLSVGKDEVNNATFHFMVDLIYKDKRFDEPFSIYLHETSLLWLPVSNSDQVTIENLILNKINVGLWDSDLEHLWTMMTCISYSKLAEPEKVINNISDVIKHGLQIPQEKLKEDTLCTLAHCIKAILILEKRTNSILDTLPWKSMVLLIKDFPTNEHVLQAFEAYCSYLGEELEQFSKEYYDELYDILKFNINSPHKLSSLLTLKICKQFDYCTGDMDTDQDILQHCIDALNIEVLLNTYQERLKVMRMVTWNSNMKQVHQDAALRFLISNLYINFSLMWEPVYELVASYADSKNKLFWQIWVDVLNNAADICASQIPSPSPAITSSGTFSKCFTSISQMKDEVRVDHRNFRMLLWNAMCKFSGLVEKNAKDIVPLYLRFMRDEYSLIDEMIAKKQDLSIKNEKDLVKENRKSGKKGKSEFQALCAHLRVFATFKKPKVLEKEFQLYQWYLDFLTSKDNEIQCLAINCLMTYSHPYMTPYKLNFDKLMDDTKFRDELMFFTASPDEEVEGIINHEHLNKLMPILIRLLYGKLQRRSGLGVSGKSGSSARRNIIMQFLINCSNEEIETFFDLILEPFKTLEDVSFTDSSVDITSIVPLRKQTGFLNMISTVMTRLAKKVGAYIPQLLDTLLKVLWMCSEVLKVKDQVHVSYITRIKDIRRLGLVQLNDLFEREEENFKYEDNVTDIFTVAVFPQLPDIAIESCQCPTPLLKLFVTWSKHKKYHYLLSVKNKDGLFPLSSLFQLLKQKSLTGTVENLIMIIISNLLSQEDTKSSDIDEESECFKMIKPFIIDILNHISRNLLLKTKDAKKKRMMKNVIPNIQFSVLSQLTKLVVDTEQSSAIVGILFPLLQCIGSEATQFHIVTTINNLLPYIESTVRYVSMVPSLFSMIQTRNPRQVLCEVYVKMTKNNDSLELIGDLLYRLNAWDPTRVDEPDYDKRLQAFRDTNEQIKANEWNSDQIIPILHNALHFLLTTEDLSLRNASSSCIENIIHTVESKSVLFSDVVVKVLFPFVKSGIKSKREEVRVEFISLLGLLVKTFAHHNQFMDMACLYSDDPETDFFKNFNHIQVHRKIRAIRQLSSACSEGKLSVSNMFFIMIPIITPFIFTKLAASKDHNLLTETISAVGCIMKQMPWSKYSHVLKNYLKILQKDLKNQKNILRLLMAVLNNFHFDLSPLDATAESPVAKSGVKNASPLLTRKPEKIQKEVSNEEVMENKEKEINDGGEEDKEVMETQVGDDREGDKEDKETQMGDDEEEDKEVMETQVSGDGEDKEVKDTQVENDEAKETQVSDVSKEGGEVEGTNTDDNNIASEKASMDDEHDGMDVKTTIDEKCEEDEGIEMDEECDEEKENQMDEERDLDVEAKEIQTDEICEEDLEDKELDVNEEYEEIIEDDDEPSLNATSHDSLRRIYVALTDFIIPQLNKFLQKKNLYDSSKSNYKEVDDQGMLKLPMELALSQLLQKLPGGILHLNLPGVLLRVSQSLRSHSKEVREMARDTIKKISCSLGAAYLPMVLKEMKSILQHGYQRHVLGFTLHNVLDNMTEMLNAGDLDNCVHDVMEVVVEELVGIVGEEKEVSAIANKLFEAQHRKSNPTCEITAKFVSSESIAKVVSPLKEVLDSSQTHSVIHKIEEALFHIATGLQSNKGLIDRDMLIFIHGVLSDAMHSISDKGSDQNENNTGGNEIREDGYMVAEKPTRGGVAPRTSEKTNNHVLVTFGLHLLNSCLKRQRFVESDMDHIQMLDPIIPLIMTNITSRYNKIVMSSLKCLCLLFKFHLPSTKSYFSSLGKNLFKIMKTFTQAGATKGKDVELIANSFKAMTILIRDYKDFPVNDKQFKILLSLVEEDIHISSRQIVALPLLKSILSRKVKITFVNDIITKISDLSIRDSDNVIQLQCRKIVLQFMLDYPLGKKVINHFDFYITHLSYEEESGRISALEMLTLVFNNIPQKLLIEYAGYIFIPLVMMLVNDDSATCRKLCGCTIKVLIRMLDVNTRGEMFNIVKKFYGNDNVSLRHVSIQIIGLFAEVEKKSFNRHANNVLSLFEETLQSYAKMKVSDGSNADDKSLYNTVNCLVKIFNETGLLGSNESYVNQLGRVCDLCKVHLLHPHAWIRLSVSQLFSLYFSSFTPEDWIKKSLDENALKLEDFHIVKDLCFSFLAQLKDSNLSKEIGEQATKNLVFLFRVVKLRDPLTNSKDEDGENDEGNEEKDDSDISEEKERPMSVKLFIRKLCQLAAYESANNPKETKKRICVLRLIASLSLCLGEDYLKDYLIHVLQPIHREISSSSNEDSSIYTLAQEVLELIQNIVKKDAFADAYAKMQKNRLDVKEAKKRKFITEAVTNPSHVALRKQKKNLAKRDQRKRKLNERNPTRKFKKIRTSNDNES